MSLAVRLTGPLVSLRSPVGVAIGLFRLSYRPACLASPTVAIGKVLIEAVMATSIASSEEEDARGKPWSRGYAPTNVRVAANAWYTLGVESEGDHDTAEERLRALRLSQRPRILRA